MHITDHLQPCCVALRQQADSLPAAIHQLVELVQKSGCLTDTVQFEQDVLEREKMGGICMGRGLAIPHAKSAGVAHAELAALTLDPPLPCNTPDGEPVRLLFLIAAPADANDLHVQMLAGLATLLLDEEVCRQMLDAPTPTAFCSLIARHEEPAPPPAEESPAAETPPPPAQYRLLAVTACPMGVAHTYLAAEALRKAAQERGVTIKVETNGAVGVNDELESDEIAAADCIIIAADKGVSMARFVGKRLVTVSAGDAVRNADAVLNKALNSKVPVYRGGNAFRTSDWRELGRETYRHLMNGISYMIPFVVVGGVMIALSLLLAQMGLAQKYCDLLNNIGKEAFVLIYPVLAASIAVSIGDAPAFMPGLMGGYMAQLGTTAGNKLSWVSSGFWGALIAGFAAGLLVRFLNGLGKKIPENLQQVRSSFLTPLLSLLGIAALMALAVNPPLGRFNQKLYRALDSMRGGSRLTVGAVLGALMATDYGGPINKAAYLTGTLALVSDQLDIMAAVMIGGMVPPIGVALACLLFPHRFTREERRTAPQNLLMGASFVTEGALPFALRDPLRVVPACMAGSSLAGALAVGWPVLRDGLQGLKGRPSADTMPALAACGALVQAAVALLNAQSYQNSSWTLLSGVAALGLFLALLGSRVLLTAVRNGYDLAARSPEGLQGAFRVRDKDLIRVLARSLDQKDPWVLLSRPVQWDEALVEQSFGERASERRARKTALILLGAAVLSGLVFLLFGGGPNGMAAALTSMLCMGAPLSSTLVAGIASLRLQKTAAAAGAVVPGWAAIEELGGVDTVQVDADELFTADSVNLEDIRIFKGGRIDRAILYAASILNHSCETLRGLFRQIIEDRTEILYPVKDLEVHHGLGFAAWCDNNRVLIGNRLYMEREGVPLPEQEYEDEHSQNGALQILYLAVSGSLHAMFVLHYVGGRNAARGLEVLQRENIRLLVTCEDPSLTARHITEAYHLPEGMITLLDQEQCSALTPAQPDETARCCMLHDKGFASLIGGLRAAEKAQNAETSATTVQMVSVWFSVVIGALLTYAGSIGTLSVAAVLMYQAAWSALSIAVCALKQHN